MKNTMPSLFLYGLYAIGLVIEGVIIRILKKKDPEKLKTIRWSMVISYILPGLALGVAGVMPVEELWLPCLLGAGISYYMHFRLKRESGQYEENPYKRRDS